MTRVLAKNAKHERETSGGSSMLEPGFATAEKLNGKAIRIKPLECFNEYVAILVLPPDTNIEVAAGTVIETRGVVVGVGPGWPGADGKRCPSQTAVGKTVLYADRTVAVLKPRKGIYKGLTIVIISEKNLLMALDPVPVEIIRGPAANIDRIEDE